MLDGLVQRVGPERFRRACEAAWATAAGTGRSGGGSGVWDGDLAEVPHELSDLVEADVGLTIGLYRAMPCFANLMYAEDLEQQPRFWAELRTLLDDADERLADPVLYWLWCGPFESAARVDLAWREVTEDADDLRLRRLLEVSGPVPWSLKAPLLQRCAGRPDLHRAVLHALEFAAGDVFGQIDTDEAHKLLGRLQVPPEPAANLRARLTELATQSRKPKRKRETSARYDGGEDGRRS